MLLAEQGRSSADAQHSARYPDRFQSPNPHRASLCRLIRWFLTMVSGRLIPFGAFEHSAIGAFKNQVIVVFIDAQEADHAIFDQHAMAIWTSSTICGKMVDTTHFPSISARCKINSSPT